MKETPEITFQFGDGYYYDIYVWVHSECEKSLYRNEGLLELADVRSVAVEGLLQKTQA